MSFLDDVIFPVHISKGSVGGPEWEVEIVQLESGHEERNTPWSAPLRSYDVKYGIRTKNELYEVLELYKVALGALKGFRYLDWADYKSCPPDDAYTELDQVLGTGDGATTSFEIWKSYSVGPHEHLRRIHKPYEIAVAADGTTVSSGMTVDMATGNVTFDTAPAAGVALTWGGLFHVPVRFDGKLNQMTLNGKINDIPSIPLQELRL
ncbi:MAG: DUF2460 domain-containing protein [Paracoccaceae bacterium]